MKKFGLLTAAFLMIGLLFGTQAMAQHIELGVAKSAPKKVFSPTSPSKVPILPAM